MTTITAQVSLYPLGRDEIAGPIQVVIDTLREYALLVEVGTMSTVVCGGTDTVFEALRACYRRAEALGPIVLQVTISNACPLPARDPSEPLT